MDYKKLIGKKVIYKLHDSSPLMSSTVAVVTEKETILNVPMVVFLLDNGHIVDSSRAFFSPQDVAAIKGL